MSWKDRFAVVWTRASGAPEKLADMVLTETELRVTFSDHARGTGIPGLSMLHDMSDRDLVTEVILVRHGQGYDVDRSKIFLSNSFMPTFLENRRYKVSFLVLTK